MEMQTKELILRTPLHQMGLTEGDRFPVDGFGAVLARAGVGKTAFLVQLALDYMLRGNNVLHISLDDPVRKVALWYREVFQNLSGGREDEQLERLWETMQPRRFIMTFKVEGFSVPKIEERLTDLTAQEIFRPAAILVDGLPFEEVGRNDIEHLKRLAGEHRARVWFTIRTHRHEAPGQDGLPPQMDGLADLFDAVVLLQPEGKQIHVRLVQDAVADPHAARLRLDPATMLVCNGG